MTYTAADDPACYPGTEVLRNKADIKDADRLAEFELAMFITRSEEDWPDGNLDYTHYKDLHHHLFQDVYDWAGEIRKVRIGKKGHWFCYPENIDDQMEAIFAELIKENWFRDFTRNEFIEMAAHFLAEINAIHPFREGNGRTQMSFLILLAESAGYLFQDSKLDQDIVLNAMVASFRGHEKPLVQLLADLIKSA